VNTAHDAHQKNYLDTNDFPYYTVYCSKQLLYVVHITEAACTTILCCFLRLLSTEYEISCFDFLLGILSNSLRKTFFTFRAYDSVAITRQNRSISRLHIKNIYREGEIICSNCWPLKQITMSASRRVAASLELSNASMLSASGKQSQRSSESSGSTTVRRSSTGHNSDIQVSNSSRHSTHGGTTASGTSSKSEKSPEIFLLDRMGGEKALDAVVEEFYRRMLEDEVLEVFFRGTIVKKIKRHQKAFLKLAFTKIPETIDVPLYLLQKHERLFHEHGLNATHFDRVAVHLVETLQSMGVPKKIIDEVVGIVGPLRAVFENGAEIAARPKDVLQIMPPSDFLIPVTESGVIESLMHALQVAGVTLVRVVSASVGDCLSKSIPVTAFQANTLVHLGETHVVRPDFASLRILPNTKTAMVFGYRVDTAAELTTLHSGCPRGLLARILETSRVKQQLLFRIGGSMTFRILDKGSDVDGQEGLLDTVLQHLKRIHLPVAHSECGDSSMTIVFRVQRHPVKFVDSIGMAKCIITSAAKTAGKRVSFDGGQNQSGLSLQVSYRHERKPPDTSTISTGSFSSMGTDQEPQYEGNYFAVDGQSFVEGILEQLPSIIAVTKEAFGGGEHTKVGWKFDSKDAALGVCRLNGNPAFVDYRLADATVNLYLGLSAILACGVVGFVEKKKLRLPLPGNMDAADLPASLELALALFEKNTFLEQVMGVEMKKAFVHARNEETKQQVMLNSFF
jgi:hemoglobin